MGRIRTGRLSKPTPWVGLNRPRSTTSKPTWATARPAPDREIGARRLAHRVVAPAFLGKETLTSIGAHHDPTCPDRSALRGRRDRGLHGRTGAVPEQGSRKGPRCALDEEERPQSSSRIAQGEVEIVPMIRVVTRTLPIRAGAHHVGHSGPRITSAWFHADRTAGRHRRHRRLDRPAAPGRAGGPRGGAAESVRQQPQATGPGHAYL